jgi:hypothetical protein
VSVVYNPKSGYTGSDSFTFTANDKSSTSNTAKVFITVSPVTQNNSTAAPGNENKSSMSSTTSRSSNETD